MRVFMCRRYFNWVVSQNPCGCHPFDLMIETKNPKYSRCVTICGFKNQEEIDEYLNKRFIFEYK